MNATLTLSAFLVAVAAAVRSTWSPCGLSMLSTITPFGERARGHRYGATVAWFVVGSTLGGLCLGGAGALLAAAVRSAGPDPVTAGSAGLAAVLLSLVSDTGLAGVRLPVHRRQVNERWLDAYRPWVYGAGFGFQIGTGVATYITTAAVYASVVLAALTGRPSVGLAVGVAFGLVRGTAVTLTHRVTTPALLLAFHRHFAALLPRVQTGLVSTLVLAAVALGIAVGPGPALAVGASVAAATVSARLGTATARRRSAPRRTVDPSGVEDGPSVAVG